MTVNSRLSHLFELHINRKATAAERDELMGLLANQRNEEQAKELFAGVWEKFNPSVPAFSSEQSELMLDKILSNAPDVKPKVSRLWTKIAVAASVVVVLGAGIWFYTLRQQDGKEGNATVRYANDVEPGKNTATLTLADRRVIDLSDAKTGVVVDNSGVTYSDGSFVRDASGSPSSGPLKGGQSTTGPVSIPSLSGKGQTVGTNEQLTMSTPRGGTYQVILPDGTRVWLNAASALKFPAAFTGLVNRKVELSGEAYFEVKKDRKHPFIVVTDRQRVEVLGTHFNINAYGDEGVVRTTLLEGSVNVNGTILKPDQQAVLTGKGLVVKPVEAEDAVAWKNGYFMFNNENLETAMIRIARWYNVEVVYADNEAKKGSYFGTISKYENISKVLHMLERTELVNFKIEGKTIKISKKN